MNVKQRREIVAALVKAGRKDLAQQFVGTERVTITANAKAMMKSVDSLLKQAKQMGRSKFPLESSMGIKIVGLLMQVKKSLSTAMS
jgi:uncharacterized protein YqeY